MWVNICLTLISTSLISQQASGDNLKRIIIPAATDKIADVRENHKIATLQNDDALTKKVQEKCDSKLVEFNEKVADTLNTDEPMIVNDDGDYAKGYTILISRAKPAKPQDVKPYRFWTDTSNQKAWPNSTHIGIAVSHDSTNVLMCAAISPSYDPSRAKEIKPPAGVAVGQAEDVFLEGEEWLEELNRISTEEHNKLRSNYNGAKPLKTNAEYARFCVKWAKDMCENGFKHSTKRPGGGESIAASHEGANESAVSQAIQSWYSEVSIYTADCAADFYSVGHFMAIVAKPNLEVGIGVYISDKCTSYKAFTCANYGPGSYGNDPDDRPTTIGGTCAPSARHYITAALAFLSVTV